MEGDGELSHKDCQGHEMEVAAVTSEGRVGRNCGTPDPEQQDCLQCLVCWKTFSSKSSLRIHERRHSKDFHINCNECDDKFLTTASRNEHIAKVHSMSAVCKCKVCGKELTSYRGMRHHIAKHNPELFPCNACEKKFTTASLLNRHERSHTKSLKCDQCAKTFSCTANLKKHSILHSDRPTLFQCEVCDFRSKWFNSVKRHVNVVHSDERPFTCESCGKGFKAKECMAKHVRKQNCLNDSTSRLWEHLV